MLKRGQITTFIIVGVLVLVVTGLILFLSKSLIKDKTAVEEEKAQGASTLSAPIQNYIERCVEETSKEAITFVSQQGGYYQLPELSDTSLLLPYYFYQNGSELISKEELENQISQYIDQELFFCVRNFAYFEEQGYQIKQQEISTTTSVNPIKVIVSVQFPVTIKKGEVTTSLVKFSTSTNSRIGTVHQLLVEFFQQQSKEPNSICLSCLSKLAAENDLRTRISIVNENEYKFVVIDDKVPVNEEPLNYNFLNMYEFGNGFEYGSE